ncbi:MAG: hypothetical protein RTU30_06020 [Candidatus Thorarchaeota archaeon]
MSPVNVGYRPGSERNSAVLEPYLWIALTILLGIIIGNLLPIIGNDLITPVFLILIPIGLVINQTLSEIKVRLYKHDVDTTRLQGLLDQAVEKLNLRDPPNVEIWIGQEQDLTVYCVSTMRHKALALSESAKNDILSNPHAGKAILAERIMEVENPPYLISLFYSLLFCVSTFIGLRRVDIIDWSIKNLADLFVIFMLSVIVIMVFRYRRGWLQHKERIIEERFGVKLESALYLVFGGCSGEVQQYSKISGKPLVFTALISYAIIILVYLVVWESIVLGTISGPLPLLFGTDFVIVLIIFLPFGVLLLVGLLRRKLTKPEGHLESPDQFCLDVQELLNEWVYDKSITVHRIPEGKAIVIYDPKGKVFHRGKYLVTDSVVESIQDANQMVSYLADEAKLEENYGALSSIVWGPLLVIALFAPSALLYGYFRSQLYVLGGELSVLGLLLTYTLIHSAFIVIVTLLLRLTLTRRYRRHLSRYPNHAQVLTKLIQDGITSSTGLPSFEERLKSIEKSRTKGDSE